MLLPIEISLSDKDSSAINQQKHIIRIIMTEVIKESLLDKLLKSRYPLTNYLNRQQKFIKVFLTTQIDIASVPNGTKFIFQSICHTFIYRM